MTNSERAEKIARELAVLANASYENPNGLHIYLVKAESLIISQLDEVVREARLKARKNVKEEIDCAVEWSKAEKIEEECKLARLDGFSEGFAAAREKAAGIADSEVSYERQGIAGSIRAMEVDK